MATAREQLAQFAAGSKALPKLCREYKKERATVHLKELVGGALSFYAAAAVAKTGGVHIFVAEDRDAAAYLLNDFYNLLDEKQVYFFPSSYKRSAAYGAEDAQGVVQRTTAMNAVRGFTKGYLVVCTCPEALAERVADAEALQRELEALPHVVTLDIDALAKAAASPRSANMVLLGAAAPFLGLEAGKFEQGIRAIFARKGDAVVEMNLAAFRAGYEQAKKQIR